MLKCISTAHARTKCGHRFWARHFSCKFRYKVGLMTCWRAFRLCRLAQSGCVCLRSGHVGLAMNFWSRITPLELALALVQVYFCPGWKKLPNMTVQVFIVAAQVCHYLRQPIHAMSLYVLHCIHISWCYCRICHIFLVVKIISLYKKRFLDGRDHEFRKNVSMDARYRLSKQYFRAGIARHNPGGNHPRKYRRLFVAKML
jgi:hypothetical protein